MTLWLVFKKLKKNLGLRNKTFLKIRWQMTKLFIFFYFFRPKKVYNLGQPVIHMKRPVISTSKIGLKTQIKMVKGTETSFLHKIYIFVVRIYNSESNSFNTLGKIMGKRLVTFCIFHNIFWFAHFEKKCKMLGKIQNVPEFVPVQISQISISKSL